VASSASYQKGEEIGHASYSAKRGEKEGGREKGFTSEEEGSLPRYTNRMEKKIETTASASCLYPRPRGRRKRRKGRKKPITEKVGAGSPGL